MTKVTQAVTRDTIIMGNDTSISEVRYLDDDDGHSGSD